MYEMHPALFLKTGCDTLESVGREAQHDQAPHAAEVGGGELA
jgi:hypothetical protein